MSFPSIAATAVFRLGARAVVEGPIVLWEGADGTVKRIRSCDSVSRIREVICVDRRIACYRERILCKLRSCAWIRIRYPPTLVNIFGGGNGNTDIDDAAEEICSKWGPNRDAMTGLLTSHAQL